MRRMYSEKQVKTLAGKRYKHKATLTLGETLISAAVWWFDNDPTLIDDVTKLKARVTNEGVIFVGTKKGIGCPCICLDAGLITPYFAGIKSNGTSIAEEIEGIASGTASVEEA